MVRGTSGATTRAVRSKRATNRSLLLVLSRPDLALLVGSVVFPFRREKLDPPIRFSPRPPPATEPGWPALTPRPLSRTAGEGESGPHPPAPSPAKQELYISHNSTYGQRYLPSPPAPLPVLCSQGYSRDGMRTIACCCRHDFWVMPRLLGNA